MRFGLSFYGRLRDWTIRGRTGRWHRETFEAPAGAAQTPRTIDLPHRRRGRLSWLSPFTRLCRVGHQRIPQHSWGNLRRCRRCRWFFDVLPHEKCESVPVADGVPTVATSRPQVARVEWITHELHRARLPLENLSDFGRCQRRLGRKCSDGRPGSPLWNCQRQGSGIRSIFWPLGYFRSGGPSRKSPCFIGTP